MDSIYDALKNDGKARIIQEIVPGKQITLAHIIANPDEILYKKLGLDCLLTLGGNGTHKTAVSRLNNPPPKLYQKYGTSSGFSISGGTIRH